MNAKPRPKGAGKPGPGAADAGGFSAAGLTDAVLEAASSRGLLRRAARDHAQGLARRVGMEGGAEVLSVDGETVRLGPGGLAGAACTCPSRELCRHVLAAVLLLRDDATEASADAPDAAAPAPPDAVPPVASPPGAAHDTANRAGPAAGPDVGRDAVAPPGTVVQAGENLGAAGEATGEGPPSAATFPEPAMPEAANADNPAATARPGLKVQADAPGMPGHGHAAAPGDAVAEIAGLDAAALVAAFGRAALRRAEAVLAAAAVPENADAAVKVVAAGPSCTIEVAGHPPVHYVAGQGPGGMVSKAADPKALHAAALLAVRRQHAGQPVSAGTAVDAAVATAAVAAAARAAKGDAAFLDGVADALRDAARSALASMPAALEDRLLDLALSSRADALPNLAGALRGIAGDMAARRARTAGQDAFAALAAIARAYALAEALRRDGADPRLRGGVRGAFQARPALDLIGCGVELWRTGGGARGATAHFIVPAVAPASGAGPGPFSATLARAAGQDLQFTPAAAATSDWVWGRTLAQLGGEAFRLPEPLADLDGRLSPRAGAPAVQDGAAWADAAARHLGLVIEDWTEIGVRLSGAFAPTLRRRGAAVQPLLLRLGVLGTPGFDALAQAATLPVRDKGGAWLELRVGGDDHMDGHLELLAALPGGGAGAILAVLARVDADGAVLSPVAACAGPGQPLQHLHLTPPRREGAPAGVLQRLRQGFGMAGWPSPWRSVPQRFVRVPPSAGATARLLDAAADEVLALAELGGRMEDPARLGRLREMTRLMESGGLPVLAGALRRVSDQPGPDRPHHLLVFTHTLACWRLLAPTIPLLHPAA